MKRFLLDLHLFDGEGEGEASEIGESQAETAEGIAEGQVAAGTGEMETEDLDKEFETLIKGKYKDQYKARQQKAVQSRMRGHEAEMAELESANKLRDALSVRYGMQDASSDELLAAINKDDSFLEAAAAKEGLSPAQFRKMSEMQQRAMAAERKANEAEKAQIRANINAKLQKECDECAQLFPDFNFEAECQNEKFKDLVQKGIDITSAYKHVHMDEIMADGMAMAAHRGAQATANAVKANLGRPVEAGARNGAAAAFAVDFNKMSSEEFREYTEKVMSGEI